MPNSLPPLRSLRLTDMPLPLVCLPLMLFLLAWMSFGVALCVLGGLSLILIGLYARAGRLAEERIALLSLGLQAVLFYSLSWLLCRYIDNALTEQILWMLSFILVHLVAGVALRRNKLPRLEQPSCCCDKRRIETMRAEYVRFDKLLIKLCLGAIAIFLPFSYILRLSSVFELVIAHLLALGAVALMISELYNLAWIRQRLAGESWIPVLDDELHTAGRIPRSEVMSATGIVPYVRLVAISQGMIYLERRIDCDTEGESPLYDTPFADYLCEDDTPEHTAQRMIDARFCGIRRAKPRRLLPYRIDMPKGRRLVYLMVVEIEEPSQLYIDCRPVEGKWWCLEHLRPMVGHRDFSPYLESELPILEQTVFLAQRLRTAR